MNASKSRRVCDHLIAHPWVRDADTLCTYAAAFADEPDLSSLLHWFLDQGRRVLLPRFRSSGHGYAMVPVTNPRADLVTGHYSLPEPHPDIPAVCDGLDETATAWCVPGVAFDRDGRRLGRGGGWYDRLLPADGGRKIGVTYAENILDSVPWEPHDVRMDAVATEESVWTVQSTEEETPEPVG